MAAPPGPGPGQVAVDVPVEDDDFEELREAAMEDIVRQGAQGRLRRRLGSAGNLTKLNNNGNAKERLGKNVELVKKVMGTAGGDNEALARKIHARYDRVNLKQPSVELRFDNVCATDMIPEGSTEGLFTVGVDLTVKALTAVGTATRQKPPMQEVKIVQNVSGVFRPGRVCLLLGPPGGGKSMLMKALCGAAPVQVTGDMLYNGHKQSEFNVTRTVRYVDQVDLHNPALTVRETLTFSAMCQGPGYHRSMLKLLEEKEKKLGVTPDPEIQELMAGLHHDEDPSCNVALTLQLLMLTNCADTIVGDGMTRGISGGERKRVTTGEIMVGPSKVLFMDQISTGLDSASTFTIVQSLRNLAHATDATIIVALLQPEPQVYDLFDDIMLMANGRIAYQGPRTAVEPHFSSLGFECTGQKAVADFLQELVSEKDQAAIRVDRSKFEPQQDFVPAAAFAAAFKQSDTFRGTRALLDTPFDKDQAHPASLMKSGYGVTGWDAVKALLWREKLLLTANKRDQLYRYIQMVVLAFTVSTVFLRDEVTNSKNLQGASAALGAMAFSVAYMQFLGLAECAETMMRLPLFYKQKFALFFPSWAYAIPFAIVRVPITLIEVTFWSVAVYWIVGLEADAGRFFTFWAILICTQLSSASFYRTIGSVVRALVAGTSVAVIAMLITFIGMGFVLLQDQIPDGWSWMFWVSPLQYVLTGLVNNEFLGDSWKDFGELGRDNAPNGVGELFLDSFQFNKGEKWRWIAVVALLAFYVTFNLVNMAALTFLPPPEMPPHPPPPQEEEYVLAAEQAAAHADSGDVVLNLPPANGKGGTAATADDAKAATGPRDMNLPFEPITLAFEDLHYYVPDPSGHGQLELLRGIYGVFRPGVLTALMGASGAGKTTLMDVLADRKTAGHHTGTVTVNGAAKDAAAFARVMGYCEQFDVHSSGTTVEEAVQQSALLRLGDTVTKEQREEFVKQTLAIVELDSIAGAQVGIPGIVGLSGEQFKRLTIAVELVANPAILFLDEPTTGLDARAAQIVMRVVRNIVNNNRTIVCTIHQPSAEIFNHFDELLLLKRGGYPIYYGPIGEGAGRLLEWFEAVPGTKRMPRGYNPATYMLEVSTENEEERLGVDFYKVWEERGKADAIKSVQEGIKAAEGAKPPSFKHEFAQGRLVQYKTLATRYFSAYWRNPMYNTTRLILSVISALILGTYYFSRGDKISSTEHVTAVLGALFITVMFCGFLNFQMIIPTFWMERPVMYRERASRLYSVLPWVHAMQDVEIPWVALQVSIFSLICYFLIHFEFDAGKFFFYWLALFLSCLTMAYLGMLMVCITPNLPMGITAGATTLGIWFLFSGFMIPRPATPKWWRWVIYLCPPSWGVYAIVVDQFGEKDDPALHNIDYFVGSTMKTDTIAQYLEDVYDFEYGFRWWAIAILFLMVFALRFAVVIATKYLQFQKR